MRVEKFVAEEIYHICNKSIANFGIFSDLDNAQRFITTLEHYNCTTRPERLSYAIRNHSIQKRNIIYPKVNALVKFLAFIIMPDHYHILVKVLKDRSFIKYINDVENSFTRYFNTRFKRKGPLWQSSFRSVHIKDDEQLLHITRYIHINCTTTYLVDLPEEWEFSSYRDYISNPAVLKEIMKELTIKDPLRYKKFCDDRIDYQRKLRKIKKLLLE